MDVTAILVEGAASGTKSSFHTPAAVVNVVVVVVVGSPTRTFFSTATRANRGTSHRTHSNEDDVLLLLISSQKQVYYSHFKNTFLGLEAFFDFSALLQHSGSGGSSGYPVVSWVIHGGTLLMCVSPTSSMP
jgi:hypothetical protein